MEKLKILQKIHEIYLNGENISEYLKNHDNVDKNLVENIMISYEFQSGTYVKNYKRYEKHHEDYTSALAKIINNIKNVKSILEVGVGEAVTLLPLIKKLKNKPFDIMGFDISWSRLKFAKEFLKDFNESHVKLFSANLFEIPLLDNSIDVVYTSHSVEPNGGKEEEALKELYRITNKYLILLEPAYEFANNEAKKRMKKHGYVTSLHSTALNLGFSVLDYRLFEHSANPLNPTGIMIIEKKSNISSPTKLVCPISHSELFNYNESLKYSKESFLAYPIIDDIPCLLKENSVLAAHLLTDYKKYKQDNDIEF